MLLTELNISVNVRQKKSNYIFPYSIDISCSTQVHVTKQGLQITYLPF